MKIEFLRKASSLLYSNKGFTLIELLVVVGLLGILAAIVIPNVARYLGHGQEEAQQTELSNFQAAVIAMLMEADETALDDPGAGFYDEVNTEAEVQAVTTASGGYNLRDYLIGGEYPLSQSYDIDLDGRVSVD